MFKTIGIFSWMFKKEKNLPRLISIEHIADKIEEEEKLWRAMKIWGKKKSI